MAVYLQATLELGYRTLPIFLELAPRMKAIVEKEAGWVMQSALVSKIGPANTVIHLWRLPNMEAFDAGVKAIGGDPEAGSIYAALCEAGARETLLFADAAPYCPSVSS